MRLSCVSLTLLLAATACTREEAEDTGADEDIIQDADGDGVSDADDAFPDDPEEQADSDGDGVGDNADNCGELENPGQDDLDQDGEGDLCDDDRDGDKIDNDSDVFPDDPTETVDSDGDGYGDNSDELPLDPNEWLDADGDGVGDNGDNCANLANSDQADLDGDGEGDQCDADRDGDGFDNDTDVFPDDGADWLDADEDGVGDNTDAFPDDPSEQVDGDTDGVGDNADNCVGDANADQADLDGDGAGDRCDADADGDGHDSEVEGGEDCNDLDSSVSPSASETYYDGVDQNCDGLSDDDQDGDGVDAWAQGGEDCDDTSTDVIGCGGSASEAYPGGCSDLLAAAPGIASGAFWLDLDGLDGPGDAVELTCDMQTDGGGWVVLTPCDVQDKLGGSFEDVVASSTFGVDDQCRPYSRDGSGDGAHIWSWTYAAGFSEFKLVNYAARSYALGTGTTDLGPSWVMVDWGTLYLPGGRGDIGFGDRDADGPVDSFSANMESNKGYLEDAPMPWPGTLDIIQLDAPGTRFAIAWGEGGGQNEGFVPWDAGEIYLR